MGLRTTSRTPSLVTKEDHFDSESAPSTSALLTSLNQRFSLHPDAAISGNMAPALTEPLSPTNKLSTSAASASPRPTAASSPLQNNNNNHTTNNNNDSSESIVDEDLSIHTNSLHNPSGGGNKEKSTGEVVPVTVPVTASKGAFQLAFEQSVGVLRTTLSPSSSVVNGDAFAANSSQMGPMCDAKSSQPPPSAANSAPLIIKSPKISQIDAETAAKIITSGFDDFPSDIEEAITAEICLSQQAQKRQVIEEEDQVNLSEDLIEESEDKPMDETEVEKELTECPKQQEKQSEDDDHTVVVNVSQENLEKPVKIENEKTKLNIISVQELPPIKTDSTVTASEDDNIEERLKQLDSTDDCPMPISQESGIPATPPNTPSAQTLSQLSPTSHTNIPTSVSVSSLTPQSTTSTMCGGTQKDFKDMEVDHDIEDDLLQVLKGFDTTAGNDICDLAGFLSDYAMNYEDVNPPSAKENPLKEVQIEIEKNQQTMQRKIDFLLRRLRKMQARYMSKQASEEISGLFEWSARTTKQKDSDSDHQQLTFAEEKYHPVAMTTMRNVLQKIESVAKSTQHVSPLKKQQQQFYTIKTDLSTMGQLEMVVPTYDDKIAEEIGHVSGLLQAEMREVQSAMDSDATASSSGGESADEMVTYNNQFQEPLAIAKRAAWRYSRDRAAIASRWSWLMSQISDLEFKIRQHTELHQKLRARKGKVVMLNPSESSNLAAATGSSVNGYRGALPGGATKPTGYTTADDTTEMDAAIDAAQEASQGACRTRAFQSSYFRKRKLFQTANVHTISKKAARPSTIKCGCQWPLHPCALCTGRPDPTAPRDLPDTMRKNQRVALLDPGFHPVLSFPEDVPNSIFLEATTRDPDWQNRVLRSTAKTVMKGAMAAQRAAEREEQRAVYATSGRITPSTPNAASTSALSSNVATAGKRKYTKRNHQDIHGGGSHSTTPLVANKLGKGSKKHHRQRSPDYVAYHRKTLKTTINNSNNGHQQQTSSAGHQSHAEPSNHHPAHSSSIYQHSKNNKIRKLSSSASAATTTTTTTLNQSGTLHHNNINPNNSYVNNSQISYNNELNFLHCDSLDGATSTNGLMGPTGRSRTSSPTHGNSGQPKYERSLERKSRSSYDIDNIVIPYSVAAATRVELLQYKEIPTPAWRILYDADNATPGSGENTTEREKNSESTEEKPQVESICLDIPEVRNLETESDSKAEKANNPPQTNGGEELQHQQVVVKQEQEVREDEEEEEEEGDEDISDEAMMLRHERALAKERRDFQTFMKFPYSTRSRANRRIDSRAESSGANTPDPTSPAPNTPSVGGDQESIPSPFAPSTPLTPLDSVAEAGEATSNLSNPSITSILNAISKRQERRRTVSTKKDKDDQRRSSTPDIRELIPPYEPLVFPIPNDLFDSMLRMMPDEYPPPQEDCQIKSIRITPGVSVANGINGADPTLVVVPKNFCDQKLNNNNKNAFLTLNNQASSIEHITGEDDDVDFPESINGFGCNTEQTQSNGIMAAPAPVNHILPRMTKEMEFSPFICRNNLLGCSDTESLESDAGDDDPNDPEWKDEPE